MSGLFAAGPAELFPPTPAAAQARLAAVRPGDYARSRNAIDGAVTRLSPYITHGFLTLPEVLQALLRQQTLPPQHKLIFELAWREYFHHVWQHTGAAIFDSLHPGPLPDTAYAHELPADIRCGSTGVPVIDESVRQLYATGWLHNHARMWLASYVVHWRKVHWRCGADWLYAHLLDGDLASNHLSWQWVAGTGSRKPYLFNAENVARYAPPEWHSPGSVVDASYEALERVARSPKAVRASAGLRAGGVEPEWLDGPPAGLGFNAANDDAVRGRSVMLVQPWNLGQLAPPGALRVGLALGEFHRRWPWSTTRWAFVGARMQQHCDLLWHADAADVQRALSGAATVLGRNDPHLSPWFAPAGLPGPPRLFVWPPQRCTSFSQFWQRVTCGVDQADDWLHSAPAPAP